MLSDRRQRVLCALIEEYIERALPVGSKTLTDNYGLGVSSATIRNELSILEELGYISQPHTSAGRVPTDFGYRAFVDHLIENFQTDNSPEYDHAITSLKSSASELDEYLQKTSAALTKMTDCLSMVLAPSIMSTKTKQISLISFSPYHALLVLVTDDGQVLNRHIDLETAVSCDELAKIQETLSEAFVGRTLEDVQKALAGGVKRAVVDRAFAHILAETLSCVQDHNVSNPHRVGLNTLLTKPEFSETASLMPVLKVLDDETVLFEIIDDVLKSDDDPTIRIGKENIAQELSGVSMVASRYGHGNSGGIIAVIGPTRMNYSRAISAVKAVRDNLEEL